MPLESDQMRRGPTPGFGGCTTVTAPVAVSIFAIWSPASDAYQTSPDGCRSDAVRTGAFRRLPRIDPAGSGIGAPVDPALAGEPHDAVLVECQCVEVGARKRLRQREQLDLFALGVDAGDGVLPAFGQPGIAIGPDNHPMRGRTGPERDLFELASLGIEAAGKSLALAAEPDRAVRGRRDIVGEGAGRQLVERHFCRLSNARGKHQRGGSEEEKANHDLCSIARRSLQALCRGSPRVLAICRAA